jgi:anti-sigma regulatory factor (Ser/Thr protein kinase)
MTTENSVELNIKSNTKSLPVVRSAVGRMAEIEGFSSGDAYALTLAIDEALANVITHGYEGRPDQPITITLTAVQGTDGRPGIAVEVRDQGRQVSPETIKGRDLNDVKPGGLGVHIIQTVMDEYDYSCPPDGGMLLRMVKYVLAGGGPTPAEGPIAEKEQPDER